MTLRIETLVKICSGWETFNYYWWHGKELYLFSRFTFFSRNWLKFLSVKKRARCILPQEWQLHRGFSKVDPQSVILFHQGQDGKEMEMLMVQEKWLKQVVIRFNRYYQFLRYVNRNKHYDCYYLFYYFWVL